MARNQNSTELDIIIVTWNSRNEIGDCLRSLEPLPDGWRVTVVDNASTDGTVGLLRENFGWVNVVANKANLGFARANNQVIEQTTSPFVLILNPDTIATKEAIQQGIEKMKRLPAVGMLGVKMLNSERVLEPSCQRFPTLFHAFLVSFALYMILPRSVRSNLLLADFWAHDREQAVDAVAGAFMLARREAIDAAGGIPND